MRSAPWAVVVALAWGALLAQGPVRASAATADKVRQQLVSQGFAPAPLLPTVLPITLSTDDAKSIYWRSARNRPLDAVRPRSHSVLADIRYRNLRWSRWGQPHALGRGSFVWDCQIPAGPNSCKPLIVPMTITLSNIKTCPDTRQIYGRATVRPKGVRSDVLTYDCRGRSRGEGTG